MSRAFPSFSLRNRRPNYSNLKQQFKKRERKKLENGKKKYRAVKTQSLDVWTGCKCENVIMPAISTRHMSAIYVVPSRFLQI